MFTRLLGLDKLTKRIWNLEHQVCQCCPKCVSAVDALSRRLAEVEREVSYLKGCQRRDTLANRP